MNKEQELDKQLEELNSFADKMFGESKPANTPRQQGNRAAYILWPIAPGYFVILPNNMNIIKQPPLEGEDSPQCK